MTGRVCVVTGGSSGIGLHTAHRLALWGAAVTIVGRDPERTPAAAALLTEATGAEVRYELADFASLAQVRALAARLIATHPRVHVLVNNAGLWSPAKRTSEDGHERTFAVNHLAPFVLTNALLDRLRESAPARIVTVSSRLHESERALLLDDVAITKRRYSGLSAYRQSKLANVLFAKALARRLAGDGVTSNAVHPGDVATNVVRDNGFLHWGIKAVGPRWLLTAEEGSRTSVHVASSPALAEVTGRYFKDCREGRPNRHADDEALAERLWALSASMSA